MAVPVAETIFSFMAAIVAGLVIGMIVSIGVFSTIRLAWKETGYPFLQWFLFRLFKINSKNDEGVSPRTLFKDEEHSDFQSEEEKDEIRSPLREVQSQRALIMLSHVYRSIYLNPQVVHNFSFFTQFVKLGGGLFLESSQNDDLVENDESFWEDCGYLRVLPTKFWNWAVAMADIHRPKCCNCRQLLSARRSRKDRSLGQAYYSCSKCSAWGSWVADFWCEQYRNWLLEQILSCDDPQHYETAVKYHYRKKVKVKELTHEADCPGTTGHRLAVNTAHKAMRQRLGLRPRTDPVVPGHFLIIMTCCSLITPVEAASSATVPVVTMFQICAITMICISILQRKRIALCISRIGSSLVGQWKEVIVDRVRRNTIDAFGKKIATLVFTIVSCVLLLMVSWYMPFPRVCALTAVLGASHLAIRKKTHYWLPILVAFLVMGAPVEARALKFTTTATTVEEKSLPLGSTGSYLPPIIMPSNSHQSSEVITTLYAGKGEYSRCYCGQRHARHRK